MRDFFVSLALIGCAMAFVAIGRVASNVEKGFELTATCKSRQDSLYAALTDSLTALHCREAQLQASLNSLARRLPR